MQDDLKDLLKTLQSLRPEIIIQPTPYLEEVSQFFNDIKSRKRSAKIPIKRNSVHNQKSTE